MGVLDQKRKVFGNIAAMKVLNNGLPNLKLNSSFPSVNSGGDSLDFLVDLIISMIGLEELRGTVVNLLTHNLDLVEKDVKKALKSELKELVSCGVDPSIPNWLKSTGAGVNIKVKQIDYFNIFLTDPSSIGGGLIYDDTAAGISSTDKNTFLYNVIQNPNTTYNWPQTPSQSISTVNFQQSGSLPNNSLVIKAHPNYDNKKLTDFNNDYVDNLNLFSSEKVINNIIDSLFGSISVSVKKTTKQLEAEEEINSIIDCIINSDEDDVIDDTYFTFTNEEIQRQQESARNRKKGIKKLSCCDEVETSVPIEMLLNMQSAFTASTNVTQKKEAIKNSLNDMGSIISNSSENPQDRYALQLNFIQEILKNLIRAIVSLILSPKVILIFLINFKILYQNGGTATFDTAVDFLKKNKTLIKNIMKRIKDMIIQALLKIVLKEVGAMVALSVAKIETEKAKQQIAKLLSLVGVPPEVIRMIQGLT